MRFSSLIVDNYTDEDSMNNNLAESGMKTMSKGGEQGDWMKRSVRTGQRSVKTGQRSCGLDPARLLNRPA